MPLLRACSCFVFIYLRLLFLIFLLSTFYFLLSTFNLLLFLFLRLSQVCVLDIFVDKKLFARALEYYSSRFENIAIVGYFQCRFSILFYKEYCYAFFVYLLYYIENVLYYKRRQAK